MSLPSTCPGADGLHQLVLGRVEAGDAEAFAQHLEHCTACAERVVALEKRDDVSALLRGGAGREPPLDARVVAMMEKLLAMGPGEGERGRAPPARHPGPPVLEDEEEVCALLPPRQALDEIGRLGGYRVLKVLGRGGMGVVFEADDPVLGRRVALKVLKPSLATLPAARECFLREGQACAKVEHPHVVRVYRAGEQDGVAYLAMEFLRGESLADRLKREGPLPPGEVVRIGREVAQGLAAAHSHGLVHRDVKPANVWLEQGTGRNGTSWDPNTFLLTSFGLLLGAG
jgi:eukaryotic-like serine/threonine-protein kinase